MVTANAGLTPKGPEPRAGVLAIRSEAGLGRSARCFAEPVSSARTATAKKWAGPATGPVVYFGVVGRIADRF